eukprot:m.13790 g.13790  ORF g.13790 m.13790 type:complete len:375 (-) comp4925_c0_seq1:178-1302(-)
MMKSLTFLSTLLLFTISDALHVEEIENYIGFCVDYISFKLSDGTRKTIGSKSTGNTQPVIKLQPNEYVVTVKMYNGTHDLCETTFLGHGFVFVTNLGRNLEAKGEKITTFKKTLTASAGKQVIGIQWIPGGDFNLIEGVWTTTSTVTRTTTSNTLTSVTMTQTATTTGTTNSVSTVSTTHTGTTGSSTTASATTGTSITSTKTTTTRTSSTSSSSTITTTSDTATVITPSGTTSVTSSDSSVVNNRDEDDNNSLKVVWIAVGVGVVLLLLVVIVVLWRKTKKHNGNNSLRGAVHANPVYAANDQGNDSQVYEIPAEAEYASVDDSYNGVNGDQLYENDKNSADKYGTLVAHTTYETQSHNRLPTDDEDKEDLYV